MHLLAVAGCLLSCHFYTKINAEVLIAHHRIFHDTTRSRSSRGLIIFTRQSQRSSSHSKLPNFGKAVSVNNESHFQYYRAPGEFCC